MPDTSSIQETREDHTLCLAWNNRTAPKQNGLIVLILLFWLLWSLTTVCVTALASLEDFPLW